MRFLNTLKRGLDNHRATRVGEHQAQAMLSGPVEDAETMAAGVVRAWRTFNDITDEEADKMYHDFVALYKNNPTEGTT